MLIIPSIYDKNSQDDCRLSCINIKTKLITPTCNDMLLDGDYALIVPSDFPGLSPVMHENRRRYINAVFKSQKDYKFYSLLDMWDNELSMTAEVEERASVTTSSLNVALGVLIAEKIESNSYELSKF